MSKLKDKSTVDLRGRLDEVNAQAAKVLEEAGENYDFSKVTSLDGADTEAKVGQFRALNDEATEIGQELDERKGYAATAERIKTSREVEAHPGHASKGKQKAEEEYQSPGEFFVASDALKGYQPGSKGGPVAEYGDPELLATLFQTSAGWAPPDIRGPKLIEKATRPLAVVDLIPTGQTGSPSVIYMEETTFTNAAVEVAEGLAKPEAALVLTEVTEPVRKIAVFIPVTDEQLDDVPMVKSYLDNRLGFMVRQRLDSQILVGDGTAPNISGITDRAGIQTQAKGADPTPDAVYKAMTKVRVNAFAEPDGAVFHPNDWQDIRLLRTADGIYIWGNPADAGPERIWGLSVVQTTGMTENTGLVGAFQEASQLFIRAGLSLSVGYINDDFQKNRQSIRAEMRVALAIYRPAAFATVTGI